VDISRGAWSRVGEASLAIPDDGTFVEPRLSGINTLLVSFSEPISPASLTSAGVSFAGMTVNGVAVNLAELPSRLPRETPTPSPC